MNEIMIKFLLGGDKFTPEMLLRHPRFTNSACWPFTKNTERNVKFKETGNSKNIYQNKIDQACFQHDIAYGEFKSLPVRAAADKILRNKVFNFAKDLKHVKYKRGLTSTIYKFFDKKKTSCSGV